jgi:hypothetical protein
MPGLKTGEIIRVTTDYIGVSGGYLGEFSYRSHQEFYPVYCDLDIDPEVYVGTTRQRFIEVLKNSSPNVQAKILRGVLEKFPPLSDSLRTVERAEWMRGLIARLESSGDISFQIVAATSTVVQQAIDDAEVLMGKNGFSSAVDRMHTALHGYLISICQKANIEYGEQPSLPYLFKLIWEKHPAFQTQDLHAPQIGRILRSFTGAINGLNELRNSRSLSHPNEALLPSAEAMLFINTVKTLFVYLDAKIAEWAKPVVQQEEVELEVPF